MENTPKYSITWNLCRNCLEFFNQHLYRILGNGKQIYLLNDKIPGNESLNSVISINEIKQWLFNKGIYKLSDIISWDNSSNWDLWSLPKLADCDLPILHTQQKTLLEKLSGLAPVNSSCKDTWGWGPTGIYSAANGYDSSAFKVD